MPKTPTENKKDKKLTAKDKQFLLACLTEESQGKAYKKLHPDVTDESARVLGSIKKDKLLTNINGKKYMEETAAKVMEKPAIATAEDVLNFLSEVMEGKVPDQFGLDASLSDRLKAAEMLAKKHALLSQKVEVKGSISIADTLKKARERVEMLPKKVETAVIVDDSGTGSVDHTQDGGAPSVNEETRENSPEVVSFMEETTKQAVKDTVESIKAIANSAGREESDEDNGSDT